MKRRTMHPLAVGMLTLTVPTAALARGNEGTVGIIAGVVVGIIVLFLLARELMCWYYKINEHGQVLKEIRDELRAANNAAGNVVRPRNPSAGSPVDGPAGGVNADNNDAWK